jgi:hypothetical protein
MWPHGTQRVVSGFGIEAFGVWIRGSMVAGQAGTSSRNRGP